MLQSGGRGPGVKKGMHQRRKCLLLARFAADREVYQRVLQRFEDRLKIDPVNRSRLVSIQFDSNDAGLAARIAIAWRRTRRSKPTGPVEGNAKGCGLAFAALLGVKARLEKSEEHLQNYARRNDLVFLETDKEPSGTSSTSGSSKCRKS